MATEAAETSGGRLRARVIVTADLVAVSGLRIGGALPGLTIGGVDLPVIRDPLTNRPYIPGSSVRGKMRALLDHCHGNPANFPLSRDVSIHMPRTKEAYESSVVARLFGTLPLPADEKSDLFQPTRLLMRDIYLNDTEEARLRERARSGPLYTEAKTEAAIDRFTSAANPRTIERVLAGTRFVGFAATITLYDDDDATEYLGALLRGMRLLEDDYLGGHGSRGSGEIAFEQIGIRVRRPEDYTLPFGEGAAIVTNAGGLFDAALNDAAVLARVRDAAAG